MRQVEQIIEQAMRLPASERRELANRLLDSFEDQIDPAVMRAWQELAGRRLDSIRAGTAKTVPWSEVRRKLWAIVDEAKTR